MVGGVGDEEAWPRTHEEGDKSVSGRGAEGKGRRFSGGQRRGVTAFMFQIEKRLRHNSRPRDGIRQRRDAVASWAGRRHCKGVDEGRDAGCRKAGCDAAHERGWHAGGRARRRPCRYEELEVHHCRHRGGRRRRLRGSGGGFVVRTSALHHEEGRVHPPGLKANSF